MKVLMAAGGTGGHVIPALTLAQAFRSKFADAEIVFVGTPKGFEARWVPQAGFELKLLSIEGIKGKGALQKLKSALLLPKALWNANLILKSTRPDVVFGIGGYASAPVIALAGVYGMVTGILEPNAVPGFSNRMLSRFASRVFLAFDEAKGWFKKSKTVVTGNPIRESVLAVPPPDFSSKKLCVLVFGGSQGAKKINQAVVEMLPHLRDQKDEIEFIHQTGKHDQDAVSSAYAALGFKADVREFIDDMGGAYAKSHVVVARSGSSVLEIAACGRPSILIPYPYAADHHQDANASALARIGAAVVLKDETCTGRRLYETFMSLRSRDVLERMSRQALSLRRENAAMDIVESLCEVWSRR